MVDDLSLIPSDLYQTCRTLITLRRPALELVMGATIRQSSDIPCSSAGYTGSEKPEGL
jgi:hypothetical protein